MTDPKQQMKDFTAALAVRLGVERILEAEPAEPMWPNARTKEGNSHGDPFLDFDYGLGDPHFATQLDGPGRMTLLQGGDAIGYFKLRVRSEGTWRLEVHSMAVDWKSGQPSAPGNVKARIYLANRMAGADLPPGWLKGADGDINSDENRSSMSWKWSDWRSFPDIGAVVTAVLESAYTVRPILARAVAQR